MEVKWQRIDINNMFSNYQKRFRRESVKEKERREKREMLNKITFQNKQIEQLLWMKEDVEVKLRELEQVTTAMTSKINQQQDTIQDLSHQVMQHDIEDMEEMEAMGVLEAIQEESIQEEAIQEES